MSPAGSSPLGSGTRCCECPSPQIAAGAVEIARRIPGCEISIADPEFPTRLNIRVATDSREDFPAMVNRLGWPPPRPLVERWLSQLDGWQRLLMEHGWSLDQGQLEELSIDRYGNLHWDLLPIRIIQSQVATNNNNPSNAPSSVLEHFRRLIEFRPPNSSPTAEDQTSRAIGPILTNTAMPRQKPGKRRPPLVLGVLTLGVLTLGLGGWFLADTIQQPAPAGRTENGRLATSPTNPGSAALFSNAKPSINAPTIDESAIASKLQTTTDNELETLVPTMPLMLASEQDLTRFEFSSRSKDAASDVVPQIQRTTTTETNASESAAAKRETFPLTLGLLEPVDWQADPGLDLRTVRGGFAIAEHDVAQRLSYRWLTPHENLEGRTATALLEVRLEDESTVAIRFRFDLKLGRRFELKTTSIVSLDQATGWYKTSDQLLESLTTMMDQSAVQLQTLQQQLKRCQTHLDQATDSDLRRSLRSQQKQLEQRVRQTENHLQRMGELSQLITRVPEELRLRCSP